MTMGEIILHVFLVTNHFECYGTAEHARVDIGCVPG